MRGKRAINGKRILVTGSGDLLGRHLVEEEI